MCFTSPMFADVFVAAPVAHVRAWPAGEDHISGMCEFDCGCDPGGSVKGQGANLTLVHRAKKTQQWSCRSCSCHLYTWTLTSKQGTFSCNHTKLGKWVKSSALCTLYFSSFLFIFIMLSSSSLCFKMWGYGGQAQTAREKRFISFFVTVIIGFIS